jgi:transcriptional regulator with XRE-family HTH domain
VHIAQKRLGRRVRELRVQRGWTQEGLADRAGKHWTYIGGIERGERNPTVLVLADLARALGVGIGDLFSSGKRGGR